jgi:hypothetical protein
LITAATRERDSGEVTYNVSLFYVDFAVKKDVNYVTVSFPTGSQ